MFRRFLAALALVAAPAAAEVYAPPATVVVSFDRETIRPLIVEGLADKETGRVARDGAGVGGAVAAVQP